jgi:hypothetical protein
MEKPMGIIMAIGMTLISRKNSQRAWITVVVMFLGLSVSACAEAKRSEKMNELENKLWEFVDGVHQHIPANKELVERLTGSALREKSRNKHFAFFEGSKNVMADDPGRGMFSEVEFSYRLSDPTDGSFGVRLDKNFTCIELAGVRTRYGSGELSPPSLPPPLTSGQPLLKDFIYVTGYRVDKPWGAIFFQFHSKEALKNGCLAEISFGFKKP